MRQRVRNTVGSVIALAAVGAVLMWGGQSMTLPHAFGGTQTCVSGSVAMPVAPASNGFAEVAKAVTPAVVNITTVTGEKVSEGSNVPDELRDRMEELLPDR